MNVNRFCLVGSIVLLTTVALGCGKVPQREYTAAKAALDAAQAINAADYDPDEWMRAEQAFQAAEAAINAENQKTGFLRNYRKAKELLMGGAGCGGNCAPRGRGCARGGQA